MWFCPDSKNRDAHSQYRSLSQKSDIDSILKNRDLRQKKFVEQDLNPILLEVGQPDQQFMNEVMNILEKNYADPQFGVKDLTERLNISYTVIYKKFVSLTGLPPVRFIQLYRLQIAKKILESSTNNIIVSEIAYRVGFNDPKYFTRCFVKQYKQTPSSFIKSHPRRYSDTMMLCYSLIFSWQSVACIIG